MAGAGQVGPLPTILKFALDAVSRVELKNVHNQCGL